MAKNSRQHGISGETTQEPVNTIGNSQRKAAIAAIDAFDAKIEAQKRFGQQFVNITTGPL